MIVLCLIFACWAFITELLKVILPSGIIHFLQGIGTLIILTLYFSLCESSKHQGSVGKYILSMKVVDKKGERINFWRALARLVAKLLSYAFIVIGFIMIAFMSKKKDLHDLIVETYVIER